MYNKNGEGQLRSAPLFLFLFLFISILGALPRQGMYLAKVFLSHWFLAAMVAFFFLKNWWLKVFLLWLTVRIVLSYQSLNNLALLMFFSIILALLYYQFVYDKIKTNHFLNIVCVVALTQIALAWIQIFGWNPIFKVTWWYEDPRAYIAGFMSNTNLSGILIALCLPAFFRKRWIWCMPLFIYPFYRMHCATATIALAIGGIYYLCKKMKRVWPAFVAVPIIAGGGIWKLAERSQRLELWQRVWPLVREHPIVGWGIGQYRYISTPVLADIKEKVWTFHNAGVAINWTTAHNDPLQLWIDAGVVAVLIVVGFLIWLICKHYYIEPRLMAMVIIGAVSSLGFFVFFTPLAFLILGAAALLEKKGVSHDY